MVITGTTSGSKEVEERLTEEHTLRVRSTGRKATQCVFVTYDSYHLLGEQIRGKIHITISKAPSGTRGGA
jgi:hypothetical protein